MEFTNIPPKIVSAGKHLANDKQFLDLISWWQEQQKEYCGNVILGQISDKEDLMRKAEYVRGQIAELNILLDFIDWCKNQKDGTQ